MSNNTCVWSCVDHVHMPDTWSGSCGAAWSFVEGGPSENRMHFCPECGKKASVYSAQQARLLEEPISRSLIRGAFLRNGASIEEGRDDLPDWVYEGAFDLLEAVGAKPVEPDHIPDAGKMVEALDKIASLPIDPCSTENDYRLSAAKVIALAAISTYREQGGDA